MLIHRFAKYNMPFHRMKYSKKCIFYVGFFGRICIQTKHLSCIRIKSVLMSRERNIFQNYTILFCRQNLYKKSRTLCTYWTFYLPQLLHFSTSTVILCVLSALILHLILWCCCVYMDNLKFATNAQNGFLWLELTALFHSIII